MVYFLALVLAGSVPQTTPHLSAQLLEPFLPEASEISDDAVVVTEQVRDSVAARVFALADGSLNLAIRLFHEAAAAQEFVNNFTNAESVADGFAQGITSASGAEPDSIAFSTSDPRLGNSSGTVLVRLFMATEGFSIAALTFSTGVYAVHIQLAGPIGGDPTPRARAVAVAVLKKLRSGDA